MRDIMASYLSVCKKRDCLVVDWLLLKFDPLMSYINLEGSE